MARARTLFFTAPRQVEVREHEMATPADGEVLVQTITSAISAGSEMLIYRGEFPSELPDVHDQISTGLRYPVAYGYACVGRVIDVGRFVDSTWQNRTVFAFQPHSSHFAIAPDRLLPVPDGIEADTACFLPSMETAVNLVQDAAPLLGERAVVFGQGLVGLLVTALLSEFPLDGLVSADLYPLRREASQRFAPQACLDPSSGEFISKALQLLGGPADICLELSGNPSALDQAIELTGFGGRAIVGSWYGEKRAPLALGGKFHRSRIRLISSQVSTIAPALSGSWDKSRRFQTAWKALERLRPETWISHRFPIADAAGAYRLLDQHAEETLQVVFTYD